MDILVDEHAFFITGGSRGIGKELVVKLLKEGAFVGTCSRCAPDLYNLNNSLPKSLRDRLFTADCDVCDADALQSVINTTALEFGRLDGVVANAGSGITGRVLDMSRADLLSQIEIKIFSVLNLVHASLPYLRQSDSGKIVIMNGVSAKVPDCEMAAVSASRAALSQIAKMLAADLAEEEICVNTVNIGVIDTARQVSRFEKSGTDLAYDEWLRSEAQRRGIPFGRVGKIDEVAPAILFLLSPLSSYLTSASIDVAGGLNGKT